MKSFSSLKDSALKTLENKWGQFVAVTLVAYVIGSGVGFVPYVGTLLTLAVIPLGYGYSGTENDSPEKLRYPLCPAICRA